MSTRAKNIARTEKTRERVARKTGFQKSSRPIDEEKGLGGQGGGFSSNVLIGPKGKQRNAPKTSLRHSRSSLGENEDRKLDRSDWAKDWKTQQGVIPP